MGGLVSGLVTYLNARSRMTANFLSRNERKAIEETATLALAIANKDWMSHEYLRIAAWTKDREDRDASSRGV
jgi:hypothetical protein